MKRIIKLVVAICTAALATTGLALAATTPAVVTGAATNIADTSARLNGTLNPEGSTTSYQFQLGLTTSYGVTSALQVAKGTKALAVDTAAANLIPGAVYHFRLIASNGLGSSIGLDRTFKTTGHSPPIANTGPATQIGTTFATLTGTVNPNGEATSYAFQYGTSTFYGVQTFAGTLSVSSIPMTVTAQLSSIAPGTVFHYRLIALHGTTVITYGTDASFMTLPNPRFTSFTHASTTPHRAKHKPFLFTTSGSVALPASIPAALGCNGSVTIRFRLGNRQVGSTLAALLPNCTFSGQVLFGHRIGNGSDGTRLRVLVHFLGNGYLAPSGAGVGHVRLG